MDTIEYINTNLYRSCNCACQPSRKYRITFWANNIFYDRCKLPSSHSSYQTSYCSLLRAILEIVTPIYQQYIESIYRESTPPKDNRPTGWIDSWTSLKIFSMMGRCKRIYTLPSPPNKQLSCHPRRRMSSVKGSMQQSNRTVPRPRRK